jgi:hypothetical protein
MGIDDKINAEPDQNKGIVNDQNNQDQLNPDTKIEEEFPEKIQDKPYQEPSSDRSELAQMLFSNWRRVYNNLFLRKIIIKVLIVLLIIFGIIFIFSWFVYIVPGLQETGKVRKFQPENISELKKDPVYKKQIIQMGKEVQRLSRKYAAYTSGQSYLVINTIDNKFRLYQNKKLIREGSCSTGSYTRLTNAEGSRQWIFKTPRGRFSIQQKITSPLWVRPDWSFVEEGVPIPPPNDESRYEYGVLGDYAMSLGDGYLIHGTIYKRLLGMPVTHGCVRLNDEDLEAIYDNMNIGSKVYIF